MDVNQQSKPLRLRQPRSAFAAVLVTGLLSASLCSAPAAEPPPSSSILQDLRSFRQMGSVLLIAAHPDDENTQLIAYLARGRGCRMAYLSLTRGDGGQNVLGPELGEELGVIRTQELLAARRIDGGRQFFTRAIDFGFSKDYRETLNIWDRRQVLSDIVRIIRTVRPDVVVTRFSTQPSGTHGHHTASAVLAVEAFKLCGDTNAFPEQLGELTPWQPKHLFLNGGSGGRGGGQPGPGTLQLDVGGSDPVTGEAFSDIAGRSRSMHKTQGFDSFGGGIGRGGRRPESFQLLDGAPATNDIFDGVDTTWGRVSGGAQVGTLADEAVAKFDPNNPAASVPALLALRSRLTALPKDPVVDEKRRQLDRILQACLGLEVQTVVPQAEVVPGETLQLRHTALVRSAIPVRWLAVRYPGTAHEVSKPLDLRPNEPATREVAQTLPATTPVSQPYWLREQATVGMYKVADPALIGRRENPPAFPIEQVFEVGGQTLIIPDEPVQVTPTAAKVESRRHLDVIPPVALKLISDIKLFAPGSTRPVELEIAALRPGVAGELQLDAPAGWNVKPATQPFRLVKTGDNARYSFNVTAPPQPATTFITARVRIGGAQFDNQRVELRYNHIPLQLLQPPARLKALSLDLAIRGHNLGYLPGAGDRVAECLAQMGYAVTQLTGPDLTPDRLRGFDAVVIGVRAFNVRDDLAPRLPALFAYVESGGNVIAQYNRPTGLKTDQLAPYDLHLSNDRVTDENAPVTLLAPDHPALTTPNKITSADFGGWVQERGTYFPDRWDAHFTPLVACSDSGEAPLKGGLLVAQYGRGYFVYSGLTWFRQLPEGVPGAYRLFANLISLGKSSPSNEPGGPK